MKTRLLILSFVIFSIITACHSRNGQIPASVVNVPLSASDDTSSEKLPQITFNTTEHDFGKVIQGEMVSYAFKFTNTGNADLVIANISTSCGCTATEYPKDPVPRGKEDFIKVRFDSRSKRGFQHKTITVATNTQPSNTVLTIKALVVLPEEE